MGTYVELLSDAYILSISKQFPSITILGCGNCTNEALAYSSGERISRTVYQEDNKVSEIPCAVTAQVERLAGVLESHGHTVRTTIISPCIFNSDVDADGIRTATLPCDLLLTLCCPAGQTGARRAVGAYVPVLPAVQATGTLYCHYTEDQIGKRIMRDKCIVVPF